MICRVLTPAFLAALAVCALPSRAQAHLVTTGLGPVYDGILHLLASPDDSIPILLLSILAGMNGAAAGRSALFGLPVAWLAAGATFFFFALPVDARLAPVVPIVSLMVLGALVALDQRLPAWAIAALALLVGVAHGALNGAGLAEAALEPTALLGIVAAAFVAAALAAGASVSLRAAWARVALRVAGSWAVAIGLLLLGWTLRAAAV